MTTSTKTSSNRSIASRWAIATAVAALAGGLLAGCSTSSGDAPDSGSGGDRGNAFAACMRDKGYDLADPAGGQSDLRIPDGVDRAQYERDAAACSEKVGGKGAGEAAEESPGAAEENREIASCLRENGFPDFPDDIEAGYTPTDEGAFEKAYAACTADDDGSGSQSAG